MEVQRLDSAGDKFWQGEPGNQPRLFHIDRPLNITTIRDFMAQNASRRFGPESAVSIKSPLKPSAPA
jgi:hypothetical protein